MTSCPPRHCSLVHSFQGTPRNPEGSGRQQERKRGSRYCAAFFPLPLSPLSSTLFPAGAWERTPHSHNLALEKSLLLYPCPAGRGPFHKSPIQQREASLESFCLQAGGPRERLQDHLRGLTELAIGEKKGILSSSMSAGEGISQPGSGLAGRREQLYQLSSGIKPTLPTACSPTWAWAAGEGSGAESYLW